MKKLLKKSNLLFVLACALIACLTCGGLVLTAGAQEEPTSTVTLTSYTSVMNVDEDFEFAALVTNEDGTTSTEVTWESSDIDVIEIDETGIAFALAEGNATITATAEDGASASIDVLVSDEAILVETVEVVPDHLDMGKDWKTKVYANVLPVDATDKNVVFSSSDPSILEVTEDGHVIALATGSAQIIATSNDHMVKGYCSVDVLPDLVETQLSDANPTLAIGGNQNISVALPNGEEFPDDATYSWFTGEPDVASFDEVTDKTGTLRAWNFGSTELYVVVTVVNGDTTTKYAASGRVLVTSNYFYLTGMDSTLTEEEIEKGVSPWKTYTEEEAAERAVLMTPVEGRPGVYSIERSFWAYDGFQILHDGIDEAWTTKIDPYWYDAADSSDAYVANGNGMFQVNAYGVYTVTLDLSDGVAKVIIEMNDLFITEINPSIETGSSAVLQEVGQETTILVDLKPVNAEVTMEEISVALGAGEKYVSVKEITQPTPLPNEENPQSLIFTITLQLDTAYEPAEGDPEVFDFDLTIKINEASNSIALVVAPENAVLPETVTFEKDDYYIDVNNGGIEWQVQVKATVNVEATVQAVEYYSDDITVDVASGLVTAGAFGVYHVKAVAVGNPQATDEATIYVYSSQFYLAGILDSKNLWTALDNTVTSIDPESDFAQWELTAKDGSYTQYEGTFGFNRDDVFSIVYLGMPGSWYGAINANNIDWDNSSRGYLYESDGSIAVNQAGMYSIALNIAAEGGPRFTVKYEGEPFFGEHDLYLYLMRAGGAWLAGQSDIANILEDGGMTHVDGKDGTTLTFTYDFAEMDPSWPTFQFLTSVAGRDAGLGDGYWYGSGMVGVEISGTAYSKTGADGAFTNYRGEVEGAQGCEFWYVGAFRTSMSVEFTVTFNEYGLITSIVMDWVEAE